MLTGRPLVQRPTPVQSQPPNIAFSTFLEFDRGLALVPTPLSDLQLSDILAQPMAAPSSSSSIAELGTRVMNRLQEQQQRGLTIEELQDYLKEPQGRILTVLVPLRTAGFLTMSRSGVWTMVRDL